MTARHIQRNFVYKTEFSNFLPYKGSNCGACSKPEIAGKTSCGKIIGVGDSEKRFAEWWRRWSARRLLERRKTIEMNGKRNTHEKARTKDEEMKKQKIDTITSRKRDLELCLEPLLWQKGHLELKCSTHSCYPSGSCAPDPDNGEISKLKINSRFILLWLQVQAFMHMHMYVQLNRRQIDHPSVKENLI